MLQFNVLANLGHSQERKLKGQVLECPSLLERFKDVTIQCSRESGTFTGNQRVRCLNVPPSSRDSKILRFNVPANLGHSQGVALASV